uniref:relaxase/mobilization nuclease domain-containing protein n=1 Tax=Sulfitobacter litoralis TaxID=335975 RepID=UPI0030EBAD4C
MLIKFFRNGKGAGAGPVGYLVADKVLAYDDNRDLIRDADGQPMTVTREPLPEVLRGNPDRTEALIDASRHQWTYRAGVISFAATDVPTEEQQAEVMDHFEHLAFAGLDPEQYEVLWVRHTHEDRVELHFCTPRLELTSGRSLNIAPPGYEKAFD